MVSCQACCAARRLVPKCWAFIYAYWLGIAQCVWGEQGTTIDRKKKRNEFQSASKLSSIRISKTHPEPRKKLLVYDLPACPRRTRTDLWKGLGDSWDFGKHGGFGRFFCGVQARYQYKKHHQLGCADTILTEAVTCFWQTIQKTEGAALKALILTLVTGALCLVSSMQAYGAGRQDSALKTIGSETADKMTGLHPLSKAISLPIFKPIKPFKDMALFNNTGQKQSSGSYQTPVISIKGLLLPASSHTMSHLGRGTTSGTVIPTPTPFLSAGRQPARLPGKVVDISRKTLLAPIVKKLPAASGKGGHRVVTPRSYSPQVPSVCLPVSTDFEALHGRWLASSYAPRSARHRQFVAFIARTVHAENMRIVHNRQWLHFLRHTPHARWTPQQKLWFSKMLQAYRASGMKDLWLRVDVIPVSLAVAQAIDESAWGTSAHGRRHNYFGLRKNKRYMRFQAPTHSILLYMHNYNQMRAYAGWRGQRARLRQQGCPLRGSDMTSCLRAYAELQGYGKKICRIIGRYRLDMLEATYPTRSWPESYTTG